jgi:hypothetical protein
MFFYLRVLQVIKGSNNNNTQLEYSRWKRRSRTPTSRATTINKNLGIYKIAATQCLTY